MLAVRTAVPTSFLEDRLHASNVADLALAFDENLDGRMSVDEFVNFCMWVVAMHFHGYFAGTAPLSQIARVRPECEGGAAEKLLIVSEFLDPGHELQACVLPEVRCVYFQPDGYMLRSLLVVID